MFWGVSLGGASFHVFWIVSSMHFGSICSSTLYQLVVFCNFSWHYNHFSHDRFRSDVCYIILAVLCPLVYFSPPPIPSPLGPLSTTYPKPPRHDQTVSPFPSRRLGVARILSTIYEIACFPQAAHSQAFFFMHYSCYKEKTCRATMERMSWLVE